VANPGCILARGVERKSVDFGTQDWYTRHLRANGKSLILLRLLKLSGNPSLRSGPHPMSLVAGA
jgi:hypothetical protein